MFGYANSTFASARQSDKTEAMKRAACRMIAMGIANQTDISNAQHRATFGMLSAIEIRRMRGDQDNTIVNLDAQNISTFFSQRKAGANYTPPESVKTFKAEYVALAEEMSQADDMVAWCQENIPHYSPVFAKDASGATSKVIEKVTKIPMPPEVAIQWSEGLSALLA